MAVPPQKQLIWHSRDLGARRDDAEELIEAERRSMFPSNEMLGRFLSASLGGALLGGLLLGAAPMIGALLGAGLGAGVVAFRTRHAH